MEENAGREEEELIQVQESNEFLRKQIHLFRAILEKQQSYGSSVVEEEQSRSRKQRKAKSSSVSTPSALTLDQKFEISTREIDHLQVSIDSLKTEGEECLRDLRILLEDNDIRMADSRKDMYDFKRDVVVGSENPRTGKIIAEKLLRYVYEKLGSKDVAIMKMQVKNVSMKTQIKHLDQQVNQKGDMGGMLSAIDFDQLKIENQQYLERIEERNNELLRLKLTTGKTVQALNTLKMKLDTFVKQNHRLQREISERGNQLKEYDLEIQKVEKERNGAVKYFGHLVEEQEDAELPEVMDYIRMKAEISELEKKVMDWERKIEIASMKNKNSGDTLSLSKAEPRMQGVDA